MRSLLNSDRATRSALKRRSREVERCLASFDLQSTRWFTRPSATATQDPTHSHRLCQALISLGPVFAAFGRYLASRIDLAPVQYCFELSAIPDQGQVTPETVIREIIKQELEDSESNIFSGFDLNPFESRLFIQSHRAILNSDIEVTVNIIHPEVRAQLACDIEILPNLKDIFTYHCNNKILFDDILEDFRRTVRWQFNLSNAAQALEELAEDTEDFNSLRVPYVYRKFCTSNILTLEHFPGSTFEMLLTSLDSKRPEHRMTSANAFPQKTDIALRHWVQLISFVWLRQVFVGRSFPIEFRPRDVVLLPNQQIAFTGGILTTLAASTRNHLWDYLIETSTDEPDKACFYLLQEINELRQLDADELKYRFREIVPFRDSEWMNNNNSDLLIQYLFVHWRLLSERGLRLNPSLLCFYRGLFYLASAIRPISTYDDPILEGLQSVRTTLVMAQLREMLEPHQLLDNIETYATLILKLPPKLDQSLTFAATNISQGDHQRGWATESQKQQNISAVFIALLLVLAAGVLLYYHVESQGVTGDWLDIIGTMIVLILGGLLFGVASSTR